MKAPSGNSRRCHEPIASASIIADIEAAGIAARRRNQYLPSDGGDAMSCVGRHRHEIAPASRCRDDFVLIARRQRQASAHAPRSCDSDNHRGECRHRQSPPARRRAIDQCNRRQCLGMAGRCRIFASENAAPYVEIPKQRQRDGWHLLSLALARRLSPNNALYALYALAPLAAAGNG